MLAQTRKSRLRACRDQSTRLTSGGARDLAKGSAHQDLHGKLTAFDDEELRNWLTECIEDGSENFLCALAEASIAASAEDYVVLRPSLLILRRKHAAKHGS
jgi:hypothetical protein